MPKMVYSQELVKVLADLTKRVMRAPVQFMSPDEIARGPKLSEPEFLARAELFIKDPENDIPGGDQVKELTMSVLANYYHQGLQPDILTKYVVELRADGQPVKPLKHGAKKRKVEELRRQLDQRKKH